MEKGLFRVGKAEVVSSILTGSTIFNDLATNP